MNERAGYLEKFDEEIEGELWKGGKGGRGKTVYQLCLRSPRQTPTSGSMK